jgi:hypothetical protein
VDLARKAPFKAYVYAELDKTKAGMELAPSGTKVVISVNYADFSYVPAGTAGKWIDTLTVDANGTISAMVPVDDNGVTLTIEPIAFETQQVQAYAANSSVITKIMKSAGKNVNISTSTNSIVVVDYNVEETIITNLVEFVTIEFTLKAETDNSLTGSEVVKDLEVILYSNDWMSKFKSDNNGKISASVPANQNISIDAKFVTDKKVPDPKDPLKYVTEKYSYEKIKVFQGNYAGKGTDVVDFGNGTKVE